MGKAAENVFGSPGLRLVQLYALLRSTGRTYSLSRLATLFHCSRQTILRMTDQLQRTPAADLETWLDGRERFFRLEAAEAAPNVQFTPEAIRHLAMCRDIVGHLLPQSVREELRDTLNTAADAVLGESGRLTPLAEPWVKGHIDYSPFEDILEDIQAAMADRRLCRIVYQARTSGGHGSHLVAPLQIVAYREALYLRCRPYKTPNEPSGDLRTMAIHRIRRLRLDPATFAGGSEDDRDPGFGFPVHEPVRVRVAFWGGAASYVAEREWSPGQKLTRRKDGALVLAFTATNRFEVIAWVLGFGPEAELLAPTDLREEMNQQLENMRARYANTTPRGAKHSGTETD